MYSVVPGYGKVRELNQAFFFKYRKIIPNTARIMVLTGVKAHSAL
ncbi:MAG: hypothetical protein WCK13_04300 [Ignavibacteriota bacterium]|nr:hypothetical protein [Ignavibacteriota bacterium]